MELIRDLLRTNFYMEIDKPMQLSNESLDQLDQSPYQAEIAFNRLLPYADKLDKDADEVLGKIKANLGKCVMTEEISQGTLFWTSKLNDYIELYGLRFTKDEHIALIKLFYELITIPNLQSRCVCYFGKTLNSLLKKKATLSPDDLELQWEPLYKLWTRVLIRRYVPFSVYKNPRELKNILQTLVSAAKTYFSPSATQEILDELRPKLYPLDESLISETFWLLRCFLPTQLSVEHHAIGHQLWFHEFMQFWEVCHNQRFFENDLMQLMAQLASNNIGYIDWSPYVPLMFTRFMRVLELPLNYEKTSHENVYKMEFDAIGKWIASVLGVHSNAQFYLEKFLKTIETYFHPANIGPWLRKLKDLVLYVIHHFSLRLHKERYAKKTWEPQIPASHRLTEANVDAFVSSMIPVVMTAVLNKECMPRSYFALEHLAMMRPNLVIPIVLEKLHPILSSDIQPQKVVTAMNCMGAIARPLVLGKLYINEDYAFPDGPSQVLPLLFASLENMDPNDPFKCFTTLNLLSKYAKMIPFVDCSNPRIEVSEQERVVCEATSFFDDFVLQYLDKIFILINSSSLEFVRMESELKDGRRSYLEVMTETILCSSFMSLLQKTSEPIFVSAISKLRSFIVENVLEIKVSGKMLALLCRVFSKVNSRVTVRALLPYLAKNILEVIRENEGILEEQNLDKQLLYSLLLLSEVLQTQGDALLPHMDIIIEVLDKVTLLKSLQGHELACLVLRNVIEALSSVQAIRLDKNLDDPEYPYWQDWGEIIDTEAAKIKWYVPGDQEIGATKSLFDRYFHPAVNSIKNYIDTKNSLSRDELQATLRVISAVLEGGDSVLPIWSEQPLLTELFESCVFSYKPTIGNEFNITMPDGKNIRQALVEIMTALQNILLEDLEDDFQSLICLVSIWQRLSMNKTTDLRKLRISRDLHNSLKKALADKLTEKKKYLPEILLESVALQHELRKLSATRTFTRTSRDIIQNLFKLGVSRYSKVRIEAQSVLWAVINDFPNAYHAIVPATLEILKRDTKTHHDAYKGVLYILVQNSTNSLLNKDDWQVLSALLPSLVLAKPSEKLSVISRQDFILSTLMRYFIMNNIQLDIPKSCTAAALALWKYGVKPALPLPSHDEIQKGIRTSKTWEEDKLKKHSEIIINLHNALLEKNLHWRHRQMAMRFIRLMIHPNYELPSPVIRYFLDSLISDSIDERKLALDMLIPILKQQKRKHPKIIVDITEREKNMKPGRRADNEWLQYKQARRPMSAEQWDEPRFVHKPYIGYYTWPKQIEVYAPSSQQPSLDQKRKLSDQEKEIDMFFQNKQNVSKLVEYLCLEGKHGIDQFDDNHAKMFKGLFRNHGDAFLHNFLPHLREIVQDHQESKQRCAAELVTGLIRGSKHWSYHMSCEMWKSLLPIFELVLKNLTEYTLCDWCTGFDQIFKNRDPKKLHWLIECLVNESKSKSETSFLESARLEILECAFKSPCWRMSELMDMLLLRFENRLRQNPFENVRTTLGTILVMIFSSDLKFSRNEEDGETNHSKIDDFVNRVYPSVELLLTETDTKSKKFIEATRVLHTLCTWIICSLRYSKFGTISSFFKLYPIITHLENIGTDHEGLLAIVCTETLALLSRSLILPEHVPAALHAIENLLKSSSWSARVSSMRFLEVFLFYNMSTLLSNKCWIDDIRIIVLRQLKDESVEVRLKAAQVLNGMIHCTLVTDREALLKEFNNLANTKLKNDNTEVSDSSLTNAIRLRHAGVLGMCAFIQAHPYDVPKDIPPLFEYLSEHFNDPEPIPTSIRKTFNEFKRTHCDGWTGLQGLADVLTEEQFEVLQDLIGSPSYYA